LRRWSCQPTQRACQRAACRSRLEEETHRDDGRDAVLLLLPRTTPGAYAPIAMPSRPASRSIHDAPTRGQMR
jgi:hypothetical protein